MSKIGVCFCTHDDAYYLAESIVSVREAGDLFAFVSRVPWHDQPGDWGQTLAKPQRTQRQHRTMTFDAAGRLVTIQYADGTRVSMLYDGVGNRTTLIDSTGTTTFAFDSLNRLSGKTEPGSLVQGYEYDAASQRTKLTDPDSGVRTYSFDSDGRLELLRDPDGKRTTHQWDKANRLTTVLLRIRHEAALDVRRRGSMRVPHRGGRRGKRPRSLHIFIRPAT